MKHLYYLSCLVLPWLFCLSSCGEPCNAEPVPPVLFLVFTDATTNDTINPQYNQVYSIGNNNIDSPTFDSLVNRYTLPLSTLEDQVTYVFSKTNQPTDTLVITYERIVVVNDNPKCGDGVIVENVGVSSQSTFNTNQIRVDANRFLFIDL